LICLSHDHSVDWFSPIPTHFEHPIDKLAMTLSNWLEDISTYNDFTLLAMVRGTMIAGETIANPR
jgi:hypothetical protein